MHYFSPHDNTKLPLVPSRAISLADRFLGIPRSRGLPTFPKPHLDSKNSDAHNRHWPCTPPSPTLFFCDPRTDAKLF